MYSFKRGGDSQIKLKGTSKYQSKLIKLEEYKKCVDGEELQQECDNYFLKSNIHKMHPQQIKKSQHYLFLMMNDVIQLKLKVNHGNGNYDF